MRVFGTLALLFLSTTVQAASITSQAWTSFTSATGQIAPTDVENPNGSPYLEPGSGAILTGGGFLYSFSNPLTIEVFVPNFDLGPGYLTELVLTVGLSPAGLPLDPSTVEVTPAGGSALAAASISESDSVWTFEWSLPSNADSYRFSFSGGPHMAVDSVHVSTAASFATVPEPATMASLLVGLAGCGLLMARRRRRAALLLA